jgi:hypothetical protein
MSAFGSKTALLGECGGRVARSICQRNDSPLGDTCDQSNERRDQETLQEQQLATLYAL